MEGVGGGAGGGYDGCEWEEIGYMPKTIGGFLLIMFGVFTLIINHTRPDWFVNHFKSRGIFEILGNRGATAFYVLLGGLMIVLGLYIIYFR